MCHVLGRTMTGRLRVGGRWVVWDMGNMLDFGQYRRRVDEGLDYRGRRRDTPHDVTALLALARDIELEERIILDRTDNVPY